ncbi:hypothetical protein [Phaeodactylibacter xiamenensis]|uniref:hypothetical protein n=1 Tax=Phaeodactylibacter xiamenensis TaxID=1524460 RepID=UPI0024A8F429|nr:hypothetical protein [Phaeodactylibacter xiamenensis]
MKHYIFSLLFLCLALSVHAQFRMVSNNTPSWTSVNDSTYTASVSFSADQTGFGYLANQIDSTFRLFTGTEQLYRVDSVWNTSFSSADLRVVEISPTNGSPAGQVMVFDPDGRETLPAVPFGSTGSTAQLQAAVVSWNARNSLGELTANGNQLSLGSSTVNFDPDVTNEIQSLVVTKQNPATVNFRLSEDLVSGLPYDNKLIFGNGFSLTEIPYFSPGSEIGTEFRISYTESQTISADGNELNLSSGGGTITFDPDQTNEAQSLDLSTRLLFVNINGENLPATEVDFGISDVNTVGPGGSIGQTPGNAVGLQFYPGLTVETAPGDATARRVRNTTFTNLEADSHADAGAKGAAVGEYFHASPTNTMGLPVGTKVQRQF